VRVRKASTTTSSFEVDVVLACAAVAGVGAVLLAVGATRIRPAEPSMAAAPLDLPVRARRRQDVRTVALMLRALGCCTCSVEIVGSHPEQLYHARCTTGGPAERRSRSQKLTDDSQTCAQEPAELPFQHRVTARRTRRTPNQEGDRRHSANCRCQSLMARCYFRTVCSLREGMCHQPHPTDKATTGFPRSIPLEARSSHGGQGQRSFHVKGSIGVALGTLLTFGLTMSEASSTDVSASPNQRAGALSTVKREEASYFAPGGVK
jgi:hypothetical protein